MIGEGPELITFGGLSGIWAFSQIHLLFPASFGTLGASRSQKIGEAQFLEGAADL